MRLSTTKRQRIIMTALYGTSAVLLIIALVLWQNGRGGAAKAVSTTAGGVSTTGSSGQDPDVAGSGISGSGVAGLFNKRTIIPATGEDYFAFKIGGGVHDVVLTATSDGHIYFGYLLRAGNGSVQYVDRTWSLRRTINGPAPHALLAVQVMPDSTYVTCTIKTDGKITKTNTARGVGNKAVCLA